MAKMVTIRGFEKQTIRKHMEIIAIEKIDAQFPGKPGRIRPRSAAKKATLRKWEKERNGKKIGTIWHLSNHSKELTGIYSCRLFLRLERKKLVRYPKLEEKKALCRYFYATFRFIRASSCIG